MTKLISALTAMLMFSAPAYADWQFTRWGMTVEQVIEASKGKATPVDPLKIALDYAPRLTMPYRAGNLDFEARFYFTNGKLDGVTLSLGERAVPRSVWIALLSKYGRPIHEERGVAATTATWLANDNEISFTIRPDGECTLSYYERDIAAENRL